MALLVKQVEDFMSKYAPLFLKESYDNVGLMVGDSDSEVTSILVALDCTLEVIEEAKNKNCNLIITHHPMLFRKPKTITTNSLIGKKIIKVIKNDINVYSSHTNLDSVKNGFNDIMASLLKLNEVEIIDKNPLDKEAGIGRIGYLKDAITLDKLSQRVKELFNAKSIRYCGDDLKKIKKVAIVNGSGQDYFNKAKILGADCIITGDTTYHYVSDIIEENIAVIDGEHFYTEWPALVCVYKWIKGRLEELGYKNNVYISKCNKSPYKYK